MSRKAVVLLGVLGAWIAAVAVCAVAGWVTAALIVGIVGLMLSFGLLRAVNDLDTVRKIGPGIGGADIPQASFPG